MSAEEALQRLFTLGDAAPLAAMLLHRVQMEDGLQLHVGRDAVLAALLAQAAAFEGRTCGIFPGRLPGVVELGWSGLVRDFPLPGLAAPLPLPLTVTLRRHVWLETEGKRILRVTAVTDWAGLADALGLARPGLAQALGLAHPTHPPLGELASGRGQFPAESDREDWVSQINARALAALSPAMRDWWLGMLSLVPDARLTVDRWSLGPDRKALLWRLQGHIGGRRFSLPGSTVFESIGEDQQLFDLLALQASAHRPAFPI